MNKKGAEFTIGTLIVIVLAIIVLVVLVLGFGTGWGNLWSKIKSYGSSANVDVVKQACELACSTESKYDWCSTTRSITYENEKGKLDKVSTTCWKWATTPLEDDDKIDIANINGLLSPCDSITC